MGRRRAGGFTLAEMLVAVAVLGFLAMAVVPNLTTNDPQLLEAGLQHVAGAIGHARSEALRTGQPHAVRVLPPPSYVTVYNADLSSGNVALASITPHPVSGQPYRFRLDETRAGPALALVSPPFSFTYVGLGGALSDVVFDANGEPGFMVAGTWRVLLAGSVPLELRGQTGTVEVAPVGRVTVP